MDYLEIKMLLDRIKKAAILAGSTLIAGVLGNVPNATYAYKGMMRHANLMRSLGAVQAGSTVASMARKAALSELKNGAKIGTALGLGTGASYLAGAAAGTAIKNAYDKRHPVKAAIRDAKIAARTTAVHVRSKL